MYFLCVFSLVSVVLYDFTCVAEYEDTGAVNYVAKQYTFTEHHVNYRQKRAVGSFLQGNRAVRHLLQGTWRNIQHSDDLRAVYEKIGSYRQALTDFLAVGPRNLKITRNKKGRMYMGSIGDRRLFLRQDENQGGPVLDIFHNTGGGVDHIDTIRYRN